MPLSIHNIDSSIAEKHLNDIAGFLGIIDVLSKFPAQMSGGQKQRVAAARSLISNPDIILADEPTGALNRRNTQDVLDLLTELNVEGQSILMVTHDVRAAIRANRIIYIEDGRIIGELKLSQYIEEDRKSRESQIDAWLGSMQW